MNVYLSLIKREFQEHSGLFILLPAAVTAGLILIMLYTAWKFPPNSALFEFGLIELVVNEEPDAEADTVKRQDYIVDFEAGRLRPLEQGADADANGTTVSEIVSESLYGIHMLYQSLAGFVMVFYLLYCLYSDRKDRSILFWKSMPIAEFKNVAVKFLVAVLAVPLIAMAFSWVVELGFLSLVAYMVDKGAPEIWASAWPNIEIFPSLIRQAWSPFWIALWMLPINAWLIFSSALARREPFLIALIPIAGVMIIETLSFGTNYISGWIGEHFVHISLQSPSLPPDTAQQLYGGGLGVADLIAGVVLAGALLGGAVWLRNYRFEL
ncbi:MAG: hypothetical protein EPO31_05695 [Gammaproteobacteria bacterium]|nr:MAG: hypothetical protein EPO31_05695 [Gammaproteobacteria bacterium]